MEKNIPISKFTLVFNVRHAILESHKGPFTQRVNDGFGASQSMLAWYPIATHFMDILTWFIKKPKQFNQRNVASRNTVFSKKNCKK